MGIQANRSTHISMEGKEYLYFGGTNYLGIAHRRELLDAATQAFEKFGFSAGASRLTSGENDLLLSLEKTLAEFAQEQSSLVLPAGFMANRAVVDGINSEVDYWIISKYGHGSIKSAVEHTGKALFVDELQANVLDQRSLRGRLGLPQNARLGFFAEPIDPLLGSLYDCRALNSSLEYRDYLVLDEAHSFGVLGAGGRGVLEHFRVQSTPQIIRTGTFSKALGAQGGFVLAARSVIDKIKLNSYSYKVSTPLTPVAAAASLASLTVLRGDAAGTVEALRKNIQYTNDSLVRIGFSQFAQNAVPIFHLPEGPHMREVRESLPQKGIYVPTVTSYFADFCEIGLRWTVQAGHSREHIDTLMEAIAASSSLSQR
jgi:8-amino-7-oxononanoate synthase